MTALGKPSPAEARKARAVEDFELMWLAMNDQQRRQLLCGSGDHGWFSRHDPEVDHLIKNEPAAIVEMSLRERGWTGRYLQGDYEMVGSYQSTEWGE